MKEIRFTESQLAAVDAARSHLDACIVAGPGSGKTTVLVEYFRNLVAAGADPLRILAITFTEKAAGSMRRKLAEAFQADRATRARLERAWVSTIHGFCGRLLREHAVFAGIDPDFNVADERDSWRLQRDSIFAAMDALLAERPAAMRGLIYGLSSYEFEQAALSAYDAMRGAGKTIDDLAAYPAPPGVTTRDVALTLEDLAADPAESWSIPQRRNLDAAIEAAERIVAAESPLEALRAVEEFKPNLRSCKNGTNAYSLVKALRDQVADLKYSLITAHYAPQRELLFDLLRRFEREYRARKLQARALDFADLEEFAVRLLEENPEARARIQGQFDHILMDELQDTNGQQAKLLALLRSPGNFYAVGDINQSIFGFRHAEPDVFKGYRDAVKSGGGRLVELAGNFRSRAEILRAVETIMAGAAGIEPRSLTAERQFDEPAPVAVECAAFTAESTDAALRAEAGWVARRILELGCEPHHVAILVRNTEVIPAFTAAFDEAGIAYAVNRGRGFYDRREVADLSNLLRAIANPRDEIALAAVLRSPLVGVSADALFALREQRDNLGAALMGLASAEGFEAGDYATLVRFRDRLKQWRARRESVTFDCLLEAALDETGYLPESGARGAANIEKFLVQAREAAARMSLDEFVGELELLREENPREADAPPEDDAAGVQVMTVHSAKGLEFPVVFVAALHKGVETSPPPLAFERQIGLGVRWRNPARREEKDDLFQHELRKERQKREAEESSRLLYVAMTRAEERLILSFSSAGKKLQNWAEAVAASLQFDPAAPRDETVTRLAPNGEPWRLRLISRGGQAGAGADDRLSSSASLAASRREPAALVAPVEAAEAGQARRWPIPLSGQQDANATVTDLTEFAKCPRAYYLGHYLGFDSARANGRSGRIGAAELGSQVHALLAGTPVPDADSEAVRLAEVFRQSPLGRRSSKALRAEREFEFFMAVEDLVIRGQIDLWFEEGGELLLVDYKTDDVTRQEAQERARDYGVQLRLYAMAVERVAGRAPTRACLHFLRPNAVVEVDLAPNLLDAPEQVVRDFQQAQATLDFPMNAGDRCARCPFVRDLCPAVE
jgi:ATP-dependent exoDNAse (exonuclease V) beta subunit